MSDRRTDPDLLWGLRLEEQGDLAGAEDAYRRGDERGSAESASYLGVVLYEQGKVAEAEECLRRADAGGSGWGAFRLGVLLYERGDREAAEDVYRRGAARGNSHAAYNLGSLLERRDPSAAAAAFEQAARDADDPDKAAEARRRLANLGLYPLVEAAKERNIPVIHVDDAFELTVALAVQAAEEGKLDLAEDTFRHVAEHGSPPAAASAAFNLGLLLVRGGDDAGARRAYRQAVDSGDVEFAPMAAFNLANLMIADGGDGAREDLLVDALRSDRPEVVAQAALNLANLRAKRDDLADAMVAARRAIDTGWSPESVEGTLLLGLLLRRQGDNAGAAWCYTKVVGSGHPELVRQAGEYLDDLPEVPSGPTDDPDDDAILGLDLERRGEIEAAAVAYRRADVRGSGDGASNIGYFLQGWGLPHLAEECFRRADERGSRHGAFRLGLVLQRRGENTAAEAVYVRAAARGSWRAAFNLGLLLEHRGDLVGTAVAYEQVVRDADDPESAEYARTWLVNYRRA